MEPAAADPTPPLLNRALRRIRRAWSELAAIGAGRREEIRPDLPEGDVEKVRQLMLACLAEGSVATSARAEAAKVGYVYLTLSEVGRRRFLRLLAEDFDLDAEALAAAVAEHAEAPTADTYAQLQRAARPARVQLLKLLNALPDGFKFLVDLRADLLGFLADEPELRVVDHDLVTLFEAWFDVGLLSFEDIDWNAPASLLEKLIAYEAVHEIRSWTDLKNRLEADRRCYAFFHPKIPNEPLIFVEVALTTTVPASIDELLDVSAPIIDAADATVAVFYSISSTQRGLAGISFGSFLLKQVTDRLALQLPGLTTFVTLSPIPGFGRWLQSALADGRAAQLLDRDAAAGFEAAAEAADGEDALAERLRRGDWRGDEVLTGALEGPLLRLCAHYLLHERNARGEPLDPVARFHVLNGARVERLAWLGDTSQKGLRASCGLMVNYRYEADRLVANYESASRGKVAASAAVERLARIDKRHAVAG